MSKVWKFEDDVNTDVITPGRFNLTTDLKELAKCCFCEVRPDFKPQEGDIVVAGKNFGCGSSRESAALAIKASGIQAIVAKSFARIFRRNAVNVGLQIYTSKEAVERFEDGNEINLDSIKDLEGPSGFEQKIVDSGGIVEYLKKNKRLKNV